MLGWRAFGVGQRIAVHIGAHDLAADRCVLGRGQLIVAGARVELLVRHIAGIARVQAFVGVGRLGQLVGRHGHRDVGLLGCAAIGLRRVGELGVTHKACVGRELQLAAHQLDAAAAVGQGHRSTAFGDGLAIDLRDLGVLARELVVAQRIDGDGPVKAGGNAIVERILLGRDVDRHRGGGLAALAVVHDHRELVRTLVVLVGRIGVLTRALIDGDRAMDGRFA